MLLTHGSSMANRIWSLFYFTHLFLQYVDYNNRAVRHVCSMPQTYLFRGICQKMGNGCVLVLLIIWLFRELIRDIYTDIVVSCAYELIFICGMAGGCEEVLQFILFVQKCCVYIHMWHNGSMGCICNVVAFIFKRCIKYVYSDMAIEMWYTYMLTYIHMYTGHACIHTCVCTYSWMCLYISTCQQTWIKYSMGGHIQIWRLMHA